MSKIGYVYLITNAHNNVIYVGVTSELKVRIKKHRDKHYPNAFSARYNLYKLVYFEIIDNMSEAKAREKQLKAGSRAKKLALINSLNPGFRDLYDDLV